MAATKHTHACNAIPGANHAAGNFAQFQLLLAAVVLKCTARALTLDGRHT
jgi:hypothetical protein